MSLKNHNNINTMDNNINIFNIRCVAINVNSIITIKRRHELLELIKKLDYPQVILLSETKLNRNHKMQWEKYYMIRTDRPNAKQGGGTAILIDRKIAFEIINQPCSKTNELLEYTIIQLETSNNKNLYIISTYATNSNKIVFINELNSIFTTLKLDHPNNFFIIAGDFNARHPKWGNQNHNQRGLYLHNWDFNEAIFFKACIYSTIEPTFPRANTFLDLCIIDNRLKVNELTNYKINTCNYDSDHKGMYFTIEIPSGFINNEKSTTKNQIKLYKQIGKNSKNY